MPYRIGKFLLEASDKWMFGLEIPFGRNELFKIAKKLQLKNARVIGSGCISDTLNFWLTQRLIHFPRFMWDQLISKDQKKGMGTCVPLKDRSRHFSYDPSSPLDDYLGYALMLVGEKP